YGDALPIFGRLAADASNLQARELLATCRLALGRWDAALAVLRPLVDVESQAPGVLYMLGVALTRTNRTDEAHEAFTKMMNAVSPAQANFLMEKASYETEQFAEAADFFRKALEAGAVDGAHRELGRALNSLHDDENAERELGLAVPDEAGARLVGGG